MMVNSVWKILMRPRAAFLYKYAFANTDWFDLLFRNSLIQNHSVSISAGTEKSKTYASVGFMNDAGWTVANDKVDRYTMSFRNDYTISKKVSTAFAVNGMYRSQDTPGTFGRQTDVVTRRVQPRFRYQPVQLCAQHEPRAASLRRERQPGVHDTELRSVQYLRRAEVQPHSHRRSRPEVARRAELSDHQGAEV